MMKDYGTFGLLATLTNIQGDVRRTLSTVSHSLSVIESILNDGGAKNEETSAIIRTSLDEAKKAMHRLTGV